MNEKTDTKVIDSFKFLGKQATNNAEQEEDQSFSFNLEFNNAPAYELLSLINNNPELRVQFIESIKTFMGMPWIDRTKPMIEDDEATPCDLIEFLLYVLQWEELYLHVEYLITLVEPYIFYKELQRYRSCFRGGWDNEDMYEEFDFENDRKIRNVDISWKEKYKEFD